MTVRVEFVRGDLTRQAVDAIVNAANPGLLGGGGVDGAIHAAAGPELLAECRELRRTQLPDGLPVGDAVATGGGRLTAAHVIHTVGPMAWEFADGGRAYLASCHRRSLEVAAGLGLRSIAFPAISCGAFGWEPADAAPVALGAVAEFGRERPDSSIELVRFVLNSVEALHAFTAAAAVGRPRE